MKTSLALLAILVLLVTATVAQRTSVSSDFPIYANDGLPDLTIDPQRFVAQMAIVDRYFAPESCEVDEGAVRAPGYRRLVRFDTVIINAGDGDLVVGDRADPNNPYAAWFDFSPCHGHYHIRDFSIYQLWTLDGSTVAAEGHKQGFCFEDSLKYDGGKSHGYDCAYQGITTGWGDWYYKQLGGQWIDITGVPEGDYIVRVTINVVRTFNEGQNRYPNVIETRIHVSDPRNKVDGSP